MSGYPSSTGEGNGLDDLLGQLRKQQQNKQINLEPSYSYYNNGGYFGQGSASQQPPHGYQPPYVQSVIPTPPTAGSQPHHSSALMSPVDTPQLRPATGGSATTAASNAART